MQPSTDRPKMALKEWFDQLRPVQLYIMLTLTSLFFAAELTISHFTHSLTLLVDSYHMLCNIIALAGCLITIKKINREDEPKLKETEDSSTIAKTKPLKENSQASEKSLKNTFGWARIDVLVMMIGCIFLASLCFSLLMEAAQTLVHIDHNDEMHYPIAVIIVAGIGIILNGVCYLLIGGYTFHQGSYFHVTDSGDVILQRSVTADSLRQGQRRLSSQTKRIDHVPPPVQRQGFRETLRDVIGCFYVIICGTVVYLSSGHQLARYLDPVISIFSAISLLILSYPYMKESGLILLQTIPNDIDIELLQKELLQEFPTIKNIHDLHVWQLTIDRVFATVHIIYQNPKDYLIINEDITQFFLTKGITQVTIQAEFLSKDRKILISQPCLMPCLTIECRFRNCCVDKDELTMVSTHKTPESSKKKQVECQERFSQLESVR